MNQISVTTKPSRDGKKTWYYFEWGKATDQRRAAGIFTYSPAKDQTQKKHNKEAKAILETKKSQLTIEFQSIGTGYIPRHKFQHNFLDYYKDFVATNKRKGNRHLQGSLNKFKKFIKRDRIAPIEITEQLCNLFRANLQDNHTGRTPLDYFNAFKRVIRAASKEGYFRNSPAADVHAATNASRRLKDFLEADELVGLIDTPCINPSVKAAFIFCCYTGLRWVDIKRLSWEQIRLTKKGWILTTRIIQKKTGKAVELTLHPIVISILEEKRMEAQQASQRNSPLIAVQSEATDQSEVPDQPAVSGQPEVIGQPHVAGQPAGLIFKLPTQNGSNKCVENWGHAAGRRHDMEELFLKDLTWHSARLTFSILLQDAGVDAATVALLLGHTTTKYVLETYKRHRPKNQQVSIAKLPEAQW